MAASEGVDLEWAIIKNLGGKFDGRSLSPKIVSQAKLCSQHIVKFAGGKSVEAWHSDNPKGPFGAIFAKPEPKTDIVIKIGTATYRTSVKMAGGIQLASGQGASTAELFESAAEHIKNPTTKKILKSIIKEVRDMPTRLLASSNYNRLISEGNEKLVNEFIKNGKILQDKSYDFWLKNNKPELLSSLLAFVENNSEYYEAIIKEALTGEKTLSTFKGAVANSIISPAGFYVINDAYVAKIKPKIKIDIRAKSRGGITAIAFRIETRN
jgi:hypothetical protein